MEQPARSDLQQYIHAAEQGENKLRKQYGPRASIITPI